MRTRAEANERREVIRQILRGEKIGDQDELLLRLTQRGIRVTQSSVSRDLTAMGIVKVAGHYRVSEELDQEEAALLGLAGAVRKSQAAGPYLLVIHTPPGQASAVALAIDSARWPEVLGTVAGDDTIFIATDGRRDQRMIKARLSCFA